LNGTEPNRTGQRSTAGPAVRLQLSPISPASGISIGHAGLAGVGAGAASEETKFEAQGRERVILHGLTRGSAPRFPFSNGLPIAWRIYICPAQPHTVGNIPGHLVIKKKKKRKKNNNSAPRKLEIKSRRLRAASAPVADAAARARLAAQYCSSVVCAGGSADTRPLDYSDIKYVGTL